MYLEIFSLRPSLMPGTETRKLAAVMFADITGYTAMVQENEAAALAMVDIQRKVLKQFTQEFGGEIIAFYGDGSLSTYPSALDAVHCAIKMQTAYLERQVPIRIGLHLGDIVFKEGAVYGEGVNLASKIESQGIPGAVLISAKLQSEIVNHPEILTKSLGYHSLVSSGSPIELFAIANDGLAVPAGKRQFGKLWRAISKLGIGIILLGLIGYLIHDFGLLSANSELKQEKIAVRFIDFAQVTGKDKLPDMASHWISNRLEEIPASHVVKYDNSNVDPNILLATAGSNQRRKFARQTGAANLLEGQIFKRGDSLLFDAKIIDLKDGNIRQKFGPISCATANPMAGINEITGEIRGWWASKDMKLISVPKYDAYKAFLAARSVWRENDDLAERKLREAITIDPSFIDPYFLLLEHLYNENRYRERDELLAEMKADINEMNARQMLLFELHTADSKGQLVTAFEKYLQEMQYDPLDLFINTGGMVMAMSYVNSPEKAIEFFRMIPLDSINLNNCAYCETRLRVAMNAYLALDSLDQALRLLPLLETDSYKSVTRKIQVLATADDTAAMRNLIVSAIENEIHRSSTFWSFAARQYQLLGHDDGAEIALTNASSDRISHSEYTMAEVEYLKGNYAKIGTVVSRWLDSYPTDKYILSYAARVQAYLGNSDDILLVIQALDDADNTDDYDYGYYTYYKGVMAAIQGNHDSAMDLLEEAYQEGHQFSNLYYHQDIDLIPLFDNPRFQKLIQPWPE